MTDSEAIARLRDEFVAAFNREDSSALSNLLEGDSVGMPPNRAALQGLAETQAFWRGGFAVAKSRVEFTSARVEIAGDIAVDEQRWSMDSTPQGGGMPVHDEGKGIWLLRRQQDGNWKVARAIWNSDLPQAGLWSGAGSALTAQDRESLRDLIERRWVAAGLARDSGAMAAMCTDDVEYFPPDQPSFAGRAALQAFFDGFPPIVRFTQSFGEVEGDGKRAVARCRFAVTLDAAGQPVENTGKFVCAFEKQTSGEWLVKYCSFNFDRPMPVA
jgi:ketosteroid isomerase-like protein